MEAQGVYNLVMIIQSDVIKKKEMETSLCVCGIESANRQTDRQTGWAQTSAATEGVGWWCESHKLKKTHRERESCALRCASSAATTTIIDTRYDCFCSKRFPTFCAAAAVTTTREVDDEDDSMTSFFLPWLESTLLDILDWDGLQNETMRLHRSSPVIQVTLQRRHSSSRRVLSTW